MEQQLGETERARQLFEVGVEQPVLDLPEALWKAYIDFEISEANTANVRGLYNRLLERTTHPKVFVSFAQFEASSGDVEAARAVYVGCPVSQCIFVTLRQVHAWRCAVQRQCGCERGKTPCA